MKRNWWGDFKRIKKLVQYGLVTKCQKNCAKKSGNFLEKKKEIGWIIQEKFGKKKKNGT